MAKHGKNQTSSAVYSNAERLKDKREQGFGLQRQRLGRDSQRPIDCCHLTLQPVVDAVITPDGFLFERKAILENLLHQKQQIAMKKKDYERFLKREKEEKAELMKAAEKDQREKFRRMEGAVASVAGSHFKEEHKVGHATKALQQKKFMIKTAKGEVEAATPSFWTPSATPQAKESSIPKPSTKTRCPITNKPLKLKHLIPVKFTEVDPSSKTPIVARENRYMCPVTRKSFKGNMQLVVIRPTGRVVSKECVDTIVSKDMCDPISGEKLAPSDLIYLKTGATGFAGSGGTVVAEKKNATQTVT